MLLDAYRELNSRALFWVVLGLSGLVVVLFGAMGFNEEGVTYFGFMIAEEPMLASGTPLSSMLYRSIFSSFIVTAWLGWAATILALISTSTIFPDFVASGAIDIVLAKPIGRLRLFIYKYIVSLLFVLLQVGLFCAGIFIVMGWRLGEWDWRIFGAVPVILLFYSYLFAVCVFFGLRTRSAIPAILFTMLFWLSMWLLNTGVDISNMFRHTFRVQAERRAEQIESDEEFLKALLPETATDEQRAIYMQRQASRQESLLRNQEEHDRLIQGAEKLDTAYGLLRGIQAPMPKTAETIGLVDRWLRRSTDVAITDIFTGNVTTTADGSLRTTDTSIDREVVARLEEDMRDRSWWYLIGTSLAFEVVVLGAAGWIFVRRDF